MYVCRSSVHGTGWNGFKTRATHLPHSQMMPQKNSNKHETHQIYQQALSFDESSSVVGRLGVRLASKRPWHCMHPVYANTFVMPTLFRGMLCTHCRSARNVSEATHSEELYTRTRHLMPSIKCYPYDWPYEPPHDLLRSRGHSPYKEYYIYCVLHHIPVAVVAIFTLSTHATIILRVHKHTVFWGSLTPNGWS